MAEIVIFAMVFAFLALRLWSVLGKRTGHEQQPTARPVEARNGPVSAKSAPDDIGANPSRGSDVAVVVEPAALESVREIMRQDPQFDPARFVEGAQSAYRMILEAFWKGDKASVATLANDDVSAALSQAIDARVTAGHVMDNRLISVERAVIDAAEIKDRVAYVTVRFEADMAAVTRDADGTVISGSMSDAVQTNDIWTFARELRAANPNWTLVETDQVD